MYTRRIHNSFVSRKKNQSLALAAVQFTKYSSPLHNVRIAQEKCPKHIHTAATKNLSDHSKVRVWFSLRLHNLRNGKMLTVYAAHTNVPSNHRKLTIWWQAIVLQVMFHCVQVTRNNVHYIYSPHIGTFVSHNDQNLVSAPLNFTKYQKTFWFVIRKSHHTPSGGSLLLFPFVLFPSTCTFMEPPECIAVMRPNILQWPRVGI